MGLFNTEVVQIYRRFNSFEDLQPIFQLWVQSSVTSMLLLKAIQLVESSCSFVTTSSLKQLKISEYFALANRVWASKVLPSIMSFPISCAKEAISPIITVPVERVSMEQSLLMKTSH